MTTSEPTTGEIVLLLQGTRDDPYDLLATKSHRCQLAIDRLESQEQTIAALTARAEQAEARENAAIADLQRFRGKKCDGCFYAKKENRGSMSPCRDCQSPISNYGDGWTWRGQPQDGEGK